MKRKQHGEVQRLEVNCSCLLMVMTALKLSLWIQLLKKTDAQSAADTVGNGIAAGQRVFQSVIRKDTKTHLT